MTTANHDLTVEEWSKMSKNVRVLNENRETKRIVIEGQIEEGEGDEKTTKSGILILDKEPFQFDEVLTLMKDNEQQFKVDFINDIYRQYTVAARSACNNVKSTFIYPATPLHVEKYSKKDFALVTETHRRYETIVLPYIEKQQFNLQWVYNVLDGKSERERVLLDTDDFLLALNPSWDGTVNDSLHALAIVKPRNIRSIRDLKSEHLPLLQSVLEKSMNFFSSKYGLSSKNIRAFFHYPPSYYHLHIHFTALANRICGVEVERARLLQDVIDHIQLQDDYYQTKTLYYKLATTNPLYKLFEDDEN
ncbi:unnamed protein product [Adineta steineri]|uniref:m7GpppX diphosphatase n=1 Tax=Adineta steineri TaxID=433720 RepID=A0A818G6G9_9BILA|nr:unnamed protein product [Adineta steineri]